MIELPPDVPSDDRNDELADLLRASVGTNLGFRLLEGAYEPRAEALRSLDDDFKARVLWLDGLTMNPDRSASNPNILFWKQRPWLIDHGAALTFHHDWSSVTEDSPREPTAYAGHVFEDSVSLLRRFDSTLARLVSQQALDEAVTQVPDSLLLEASSDHSAFRVRAAYRAFLWKRLKAPRPFS